MVEMTKTPPHAGTGRKKERAQQRGMLFWWWWFLQTGVAPPFCCLSRESSKRKREASEIPEWRDRCYVIAIGAASSLHRRQKPSEAVQRPSRLFTEAR